jgi:hypothetical protein
MGKIVVTFSSTAAILLAATFSVQAAELPAPPLVHKAEPVLIPGPAASGCRYVWKCDAYGCGWKHICARGCPDRYSCYPLYGAYGPYGGVGYWGAYTDAGWGNSRW